MSAPSTVLGANTYSLTKASFRQPTWMRGRLGWALAALSRADNEQ